MNFKSEHHRNHSYGKKAASLEKGLKMRYSRE
jgi:hypothetical protein